MPLDRAKRLVEVGYLPKELPLEFNSTSFARHFRSLLPTLRKVKPKLTTAGFFHLSMANQARRMVRIIHPKSCADQADVISANWPNINKILRASPICVSRPRFATPSNVERNRATNLGPTQSLSELQLQFSADHRFILQTDIARFFSSVYTHAIPWAIHGKAVAKANHSDTLYGNALDTATRNGQDGQTIGIPVGPDSSHIISELVAARIDEAAMSGKNVLGYRYVDDYFLGFDSEADANDMLHRIEAAARDFQLELNYGKTSIVRSTDVNTAIGSDPIRDFHFNNDEKPSVQELHRFFSVATDQVK
ncbi:MAG: RNA-directed DNA polymerase, partial [Vulcanimicrobiaceae bacterium]